MKPGRAALTARQKSSGVTSESWSGKDFCRSAKLSSQKRRERPTRFSQRRDWDSWVPKLVAADRVEIDEVGGEHRAGKFRCDALFVHAVAGLVPDGEKSARQPGFAETAGDAHVGAGEGNLEGMDRVVEAAPTEIIAEARRYEAGKRPLAIDRIGAVEDFAAHPCLPGAVEKRQKGRAQVAIERAQPAPGHARFVGGDQRVVGMIGITDRSGDLALHVHAAFEHRGEAGEIVGGARLAPGCLGDGLEFGRAADQRGGNARQRADRSGGLLDGEHADIRCREALEFGTGIFDRPLQSVAGREVTGEADERGDLLAAGLDATRRHHHPRIPGEQVHGAKDVVDLGDLFLEGSVAHGNQWSCFGSCFGVSRPKSVRWQAASWPAPRGESVGLSVRQRSKT